MAKSDTHLTPEERYYIKERPEAGDSRLEIARSIGRSRSAVSHETTHRGLAKRLRFWRN